MVLPSGALVKDVLFSEFKLSELFSPICLAPICCIRYNQPIGDTYSPAPVSFQGLS